MSTRKSFFRRLLLSRAVVLTTALLWVGASLCLSIRTTDWHWFQRSGAIVVAAGAILSTRRLIRLGVAGLFQAETVLNGGPAAPTEADQAASNQQRIDLSAARLGLILLAVGTAIWAYGDLIHALV